MIRILILSIFGYAAVGQLLPSASFMPTRPVLSPRLCFTIHERHGRLIRFISDQQTKCMYWECTAGRPLPRQCGLQTYISEFFEGDEYNPCTETYTDPNLQFDCTRKGFDPEGNPVCVQLHEDREICRNGGEVVSQGSLCWCECPSGFSGFDCSSALLETETTEAAGTIERAEITESVSRSLRKVALRQKRKRLSTIVKFRRTPTEVDSTGAILPEPPLQNNVLDEGASIPPSIEFAEDDSVTTESDVTEADVDPTAPGTSVAPVVPQPVAKVDANGKFVLGDPCPNGFQRDFCAEQNGCLNGGTCVNQCLGATCLCNPPYVAGRRCEQFRCSVDVECMNGGTCSRGRSGISPVATCTCVPGFGGPMCELTLASNK